MREYIITLHPDEMGGYWTEVPALPGCGSQGETIEGAIERLKMLLKGCWKLCKLMEGQYLNIETL
jgi:predicted RNase H-like HicB family nuclease